ncbi:alpha/beta hydrolase [Dactylosporangium sp. AC04546]|uniref:alpha/beta fold hydrolase n=1 Tax=Dactylosporangium sp. AC04546 TaxID=2862460 RepID=UPI001EDFE932|nr:alpha/beta hydrolase [Dactylosporangium sp. AC04546]WVK85981.1 alpha/beta hydrolase [Dactylosporangium sp. AC04546]
MSFEGGRIAYDDSAPGGPLVLCLPGMGVTRRTYEPFVPLLVQAGYRVVTMDLRGAGDTDAHWTDYSPQAIGRDAIALIKQLNAGPAILVTNSYTAATAIWAAAEAPELFSAIVLGGPFARVMPKPNVIMRAAQWAATTYRPLWMMFWASLYRTRKPNPAEREALKASLAEPGRMAAIKAMGDADKSVCEARMPEVRTPALVVMGTRDPDFPDPAAEAELVAGRISGSVVMIDGAGHYPHSEFPEETAAAVLAFLQSRQMARQNA